MKEEPALSIKYHRKNFLFMYVSSSTAAGYNKQQKKASGPLSNVALKPKKSPLKFIPKTSRWNRY